MRCDIKTISSVISLIGCSLLLSSCQLVSSQQYSYSWQQTEDSIAFYNSDAIVWQLNYKKSEGRPYFHPLSLTDGTELTWLRPADHVWHRALWFSWKFIDGVNYWDPELPAGQTEVVDVKTALGKDHCAHIEMSLSYHPANKPTVLTEKRILDVTAPDKDGCYYIDWLSIFTAAGSDVLLGRTPIPGEENGKSYGGYAGLSLRMTEYAKSWQFLSSEGPLEPESRGNRARWMDFSGEIANDRFAGITVFDHPDNLRHPSPWWLGRSITYFSPALLFHEPYTLPAGKSLKLRYRILIHSGKVNKDMIENQYKTFITSNTCKQ
jgi:hypothetical protein